MMFNGMIQPNLNGKTSQDFMMLLNNNELTIFSVKGLRNYPQMHIDVTATFKICLDDFQNETFGRELVLQSLVEASSDSFLKASHRIQDTIKITCITSNGGLVQLSSNSALMESEYMSGELKLDAV